MKKKYGELIKNVSLLTLSNFGSKLLAFFLVPLYTSVLTTEEYGNFDFISVTISLLVPLLTINISEASLRFLLDNKNNNKNSIFNISFKITLFSIFIFGILAGLNKVFGLIAILNNYFVFFIVYYVISVFFELVQNLTRGLDNLRAIAVCGIVNSILMLTLNLVFLLVLKLGLKGYFLANIISTGVTTVILMIKIRFFKNIKVKKANNELRKEMTTYSRPLIFNSIGWWINNVSDRYVVTYICGAAANGIYSVAYKIPSILSVVQSIFNQAWTISAVKTFDENDNDNFYKNIYNSYNAVMVICCSGLILISKILAKFLYLKEFYEAWRYMPFLMISFVFGAISGVLGGIFSAVKDTKILGTTTILGALVNIILNIVLVFAIGPLGAAIATAFSYFLVWLIRYFKSKKYIKLNINILKDSISYVILLIQSIIILLVKNNVILYIIQLVLCICEIIMYKDEVLLILKKVFMRKKVEANG